MVNEGRVIEYRSQNQLSARVLQQLTCTECRVRIQQDE